MAQVNSQRTKEELNNIEYNYFIIFRIDIKETNPTKIETAIKDALCSSSGSVFSRRLFELKNDIFEIMCNDAVFENGSYIPNKGGRKTEAQKAIFFKKKEIEKIIGLLCRNRKTLLKSDILDICNTANKPVTFFTEEDFLKDVLPYIEKLGINVIDNIDSKIPFLEFYKAHKLLESLEKKDFYDFLGLSSSASTDEIKISSDILYRDSQKLYDLKKKQCISSLCGNVKKILLTNTETRKTYDQFLLIKKSVWDEFAQRKNFGIKELLSEEYLEYIQKVTSLLNVSADEAEKIIAIGCRYFQLTIMGMDIKYKLKKYVFCPYCGKKLNTKEEELYIYCPYCGEKF